jgi:predicted metal-dependent hydrolase
MESIANDALAALVPQTQAGAPITPQPSHASIPKDTADGVAKEQAHRVENATSSMTPPPSAQVSSNARAKSHTPISSGSHMSTPPPTIDVLSQESAGRPVGGFARALTSDQIANATADELRIKVAELQAACQEAKMTAAHHRLQYRMLAQESAAAIERMAVEARMVQCENEVIHFAEQAKATAVPTRSPPLQEGFIPVQKDLYQQMCRNIQQLSEENSSLETEHRQQEKLIFRQDNEIAGLTDKVLILRDRIRERRDHHSRARSVTLGQNYADSPKLMSAYTTPRGERISNLGQPQPFDALLQASKMASIDEHKRRTVADMSRSKKGHTRNVHSLTSLPVTPNRSRKQPPLFATPQGDAHSLMMPSTAPVPRMSNLRTPDVYSQRRLPLKRAHAPGSDGTVSASDHDDDDNHSEAETEILEPNQINESQASFSAAQMLRAEHSPLNTLIDRNAQSAKRTASSMRQVKLFGTVRKANVVRAGEDEPPAKRPRMLEGIGLGIEGVPR